MKARVKATGNIVDVEWFGHNSAGARYADNTHSSTYYEHELDFNTVYDYWEKLKHQYAGMAMQAYMIAAHISHFSFCENDMKDCVNMATALVEKLKND